MRLRRILVPAEMTARELARRGLALGLLTALPLAFYVASTHSGSDAVITGGIAMAFSIAGASIFIAMTARPVDQRLAASLATATWAMDQGVGMVRVHDVAATVQAATLVGTPEARS